MPDPIEKIQRDATHLAGLIGGLDILADQLDPCGANVEARRAANALSPIIEDAIRRADQLVDDLEKVEIWAM